MKEPKVVMQNPYYMLITNMRGWLFFNFEENGQELRENGLFKGRVRNRLRNFQA